MLKSLQPYMSLVDFLPFKGTILGAPPTHSNYPGGHRAHLAAQVAGQQLQAIQQLGLFEWGEP